MSFLLHILCCACLTVVSISTCPGGDDGERTRKAAALAAMSDSNLQASLDRLLEKGSLRWNEDGDLCLTEMVRRGDRCRSYLETKLEELKQAGLPSRNPSQQSEMQNNLQLTTALHRIRGQQDPVQVKVESFEPRGLSCISLPRLRVSLNNTSLSPVNISVSGNYRSGRPTRWRVLLTDHQGKQVPVRSWPPGISGGIMGQRTLQPGESVKAELIFEHMVEAVPPGSYKMQIVYHDWETILLATSLDGYILCRSQPIDVQFSAVPIKLSDASVADSHKWIAALDMDRPVRMLAGKYGQWADDFISKEEPLAKLLVQGLPAVPPMIEVLNRPSTSPKLRAQLLAALFNVTRLHDPNVAAALGSHKYLRDAYSFDGARFGQSSGTRDRCSINEQDQRELIDRWNQWLASSVIIEHASD